MLKNIFLCISVIFAFYSNAEDRIGCDTLNIRKDGKKQGVWEKKYFLSKKRKSTCEFENGKRHGDYHKYYKSGFLKISVEYVNDKKEGAECFYRDKVRFESRKRCIKYDNGKKRGRIKDDFWENM